MTTRNDYYMYKKFHKNDKIGFPPEFFAKNNNFVNPIILGRVIFSISLGYFANSRLSSVLKIAAQASPR